MSEQAEKLRLLKDWVARAEGDLRAAEQLLRMGEGCPCPTVCFLSQQSVEKCLKALLFQLGTDFSRTHDIGELVRLLPPELRPPLSVAQQERLSFHAIAGRYPGGWEPATRADAEEAAAQARAVRDAVRPRLAREALEG